MDETDPPLPRSTSQDSLAARMKVLFLQASTRASGMAADEADKILTELLEIDDTVLVGADIAATRLMLDIAAAMIPTGRSGMLAQIYANAIRIFGRHRQAEPGDTFVALNNLAAICDRGGDWRKRDEINSGIVAAADRLTTPLDVRTVEVFLDLARLYERAGHPRAAAILYRQVLRYAMTDATVNAKQRIVLTSMLGRTLVADGQLNAALSVYRDTLDRMSEDPEVSDHDRLALLFLVGSTAKQLHDYPEAEAWLGEALRVAERPALAHTPEAGVVHHALATLYLDCHRRDRYDDAERLLQRAAEIAAGTAGTDSTVYAGSLAQMAVAVEANGEPDRALALFREAFRIYGAAAVLNPGEHADYLTDAGFLCLTHGRHEDAVGSLKQALELRESLPRISPSLLADSFANIATAYFERGDFSNATLYYHKMIDFRLRPKDASP